jgi:hypothetical protein
MQDRRPISWRVEFDDPDARAASLARPHTAPGRESPRVGLTAVVVDRDMIAMDGGSPAPLAGPSERGGDAASGGEDGVQQQRTGELDARGGFAASRPAPVPGHNSGEWESSFRELLAIADSLFATCDESMSLDLTLEVLRTLNTITHDFRVLADKLNVIQRFEASRDGSDQALLAADTASRRSVASQAPDAPTWVDAATQPLAEGTDANQGVSSDNPSAWQKGPPTFSSVAWEERKSSTYSPASKGSSSRKARGRHHSAERRSEFAESPTPETRRDTDDSGWLSPRRRGHTDSKEKARKSPRRSDQKTDRLSVKERLSSPQRLIGKPSSLSTLTEKQQKADQLRYVASDVFFSRFPS